MKTTIVRRDAATQRSKDVMCQTPVGTKSVPVVTHDLYRWYLANRTEGRSCAVNPFGCPSPPIYRFRQRPFVVKTPHGARSLPLPLRTEFAVVEVVVECHWWKQQVCGNTCLHVVPLTRPESTTAP